ncbi:MAG: HEAT repeat domain-containing protein [Candidatus Hodarchaeota archaeon]
MSESWHEKNREFNALIKQLFHSEDWQKRSDAARELGLMKDGRAVNLLCRALRSEKDKMVQNRIIEAMGRIGDGRATMRIIEKLEEDKKQGSLDKYRIIYIIESLIRIKDRRALSYIGQFLSSDDEEVKKLAEEAFDAIEPNWRYIIDKERKEKTIEEIFKS